MSIRILIALVLAFASYSSRASDLSNEMSAMEDCRVYSQAEVRECLSRKSRDSMSALKQAQDKAIAAMSRWDEDEKYIASAKENFTASTRAFEQYRRTQCAFTSSLGGGSIGNALELRRLSCIAALNNARAASLVAAAASLPAK